MLEHARDILTNAIFYLDFVQAVVCSFAEHRT